VGQVVQDQRLGWHNATMIEVRSLPAIERDPKDGWELTFWMGNAFDYTTPFRAALAEIAEVLNREHPSTLRLPDYEQGEDFVEGILQFGNSKIEVYYEHALSYLTLFSSSEDVLREIAARLRSNFKVA
jgi:hypothetical protein